ncbi:hypothetical protein IV79_GL001159 [Pediococcus claussenii]|nr:hypothetical protein IV79_GL001159 [Pediococcus claussenii]
MVALSFVFYYNEIIKEKGVSVVLQYKRILVPVDGSPNSELSLKKAIATAKRNKAHLDIVAVIQSTRFLDIYGHMGTNMDYVEISLLKAKEYVDDLKEQLRTKYDFKDVNVRVEAGDPKSIIATEMPDKFHSDLIMMGANGLNAFQRAMLGSVADYVIRVARCDVLLVRTDMDNKLN